MSESAHASKQVSYVIYTFIHSPFLPCLIFILRQLKILLSLFYKPSYFHQISSVVEQHIHQLAQSCKEVSMLNQVFSAIDEDGTTFLDSPVVYKISVWFFFILET